MIKNTKTAKHTLYEKNKKLAREWHQTKNAWLTPKDVTSGSNKKVWWICRKGHEWEAAIYSRNMGKGCPYCSGNKVCKNNCLQTINPKLAGEWHPTKNALLTPKDVTLCSNKKVWWICGKGHKWEAVISSRSNGTGCPYCSGKKASKDNCLQSINPKLVREWHPTKNALLTPKDVTLCSNKKVWWVCKKGHEWKAVIASRSKGKGCPYCSGKKASKDNCLQSINPKLAREWHPTKNVPLTPKEVTSVSGKKMWWICRKGHEWKTTIADRSIGRGCPYCTGKKVSKDNCLQTINPKLAREWHPTKNARLTPKNVTSGSNKKVWWICRKPHEWEAAINNRNKGRGCPYCTGKKVSKDNCLQTINPKLAREWHPTKNSRLTPKNLTSYSNKKVWWMCRKSHEWEANVSDRSNGSGCPYCSGRKASKENCLQTINPKLAREWHPTKNARLTPEDVAPKSHKKVWWICRKGHEWEEIIVDRYRGSVCLYCLFKKAPPVTRYQAVHRQ